LGSVVLNKGGDMKKKQKPSITGTCKTCVKKKKKPKKKGKGWK